VQDDNQYKQFVGLIRKGDLLGVRHLVESGVHVDVQNRFGWTPLMCAAQTGHGPIIEYLLSKGADVNIVNTFGVSAIACAALEGECRAIEILLNAGASVDVRPQGVSLLEFAGWGGGRFRTQRHFELLKSAGAK
jgi:ankyrin repeat protein